MNCTTPKPCGRFFFQLRVRKINTGVTSYLAFSVPRPSILRVLALALAFLLPSVGKFAQQRLRGSCRERKGQNHVSRSALCDLLERKKPFWTVSFVSSSTIASLSLSPPPPSALPSYGAPTQIPSPVMLAGPPYPCKGWQPMKEHCKVLLK